jgi:hypothetical protein
MARRSTVPRCARRPLRPRRGRARQPGDGHCAGAAAGGRVALEPLEEPGFTSVGYGAQAATIDHGPTFHYADIRYVATSDTLFAINKAWLRISMNPTLGDGGTCYGDSGGPNFLGAGRTETNIVAAVTVTGDFMCRATNVVYRLDTESARSFLRQYVSLP